MKIKEKTSKKEFIRVKREKIKKLKEYFVINFKNWA